MTQVAQLEIQTLKESIQECSVVYLPQESLLDKFNNYLINNIAQLGYLLSVPLSEDLSEEDSYQIGPNIEFVV
jgi:hypothetical protein